MELSVVHEEKPLGLDPTGALAGDTEPLLVLKFGSSLLRTLGDLPAVAGEIYRQRRKGNRIIAVVSAMEGETDRLFKEAADARAGICCAGTAELVSLGEERTAALLKIACDQIGLPCTICRPEELRLHTSGSELDADFDALIPFVLLHKLETTGVVIVSGFVGLNEHGERTLLGRGGSDFTAAIIGGELGAKTVRLYKDVDGVFERDPAVDPHAHKFAEVSYEDALRLARPLVHAKAVEFAASKQLPIEVERIGSSSPTRIGGECRVEARAQGSSPVRVALAGYGVVGQALTRRLANDTRFEITSILVRDTGREREVQPPVRLTKNVAEFSKVDADVLVEVLSCERTAATLSCRRLRKGIPVVTASKRVISEWFPEIAANAAAGRTHIRYSAAVGGSMPLLEAIGRAKGAKPIERVGGILNGTVNFVLQRLNGGSSLSDALDLARKRGFAEEDCEADLSGDDAASKLKIIAQQAFGARPHEVKVHAERLDEALAAIIGASSERWVQLSQVTMSKGGIEGRVRFCPASEAGIWVAPNEWNVGTIRFEDGAEISVRGRGAGGCATAEAVLADLYDFLEERSCAQVNEAEGSSDRHYSAGHRVVA